MGGGATEGGTDAALREDYEAHLKESKAIIDDLRSVKTCAADDTYSPDQTSDLFT